ncbi:hypothetical protein [Dyadobacter diqingensis]|uniref:hypothetical protein n=1 Tax=Dyadobacter diqingensis TaxID=2938121 RepID=UPI0020C1B28F|nr:hypothetical protein [Dyadobacter diqingensis]
MNKFITKTNHFHKPHIWILRSIQAILALLILYVVDLQKLGNDFLWIGYSLAILLVLAFFTLPVDELTLDTDHLYFEKKSIVPFFNKTIKHQISRIQQVGVGANSARIGTYALLDPRIRRSRMEITFKDNSSKIYDLSISKRESKEIASKIRQLLS